MRRWRWFFMLAFTTGCMAHAPEVTPLVQSRPHPVDPTPVMKLKDDQGHSTVIQQHYIANALQATSSTVILIEARPGSGEAGALTKLRIVVDSFTVFDDTCGSDCRYALPQGFEVKLSDLQHVQNQSLISIGAETKGMQKYASTYFVYRKPVSFTGIGSPVLLRLSGKASGFKIANFAPAISLGGQLNVNSNTMKFIGVNALLSIFSLPNSDTYSMAGGLDADFGGLLQVGEVYHFDQKKWFFVIGTRPEILSTFIHKSSSP